MPYSGASEEGGADNEVNPSPMHVEGHALLQEGTRTAVDCLEWTAGPSRKSRTVGSYSCTCTGTLVGSYCQVAVFIYFYNFLVQL